MYRMQIAQNTLPNNVKELKALLLSEREVSIQKDTEIERLTLRYQAILEQFRLAQHKQFGKSSEVSVDQLALFNEAEQIQDDISAAEQAATIDAAPTSAITRNRPKRQPLPKDLPREIVIHDISDADKVCGCCGGALHKMGEEKSEQLEIIAMDGTYARFAGANTGHSGANKSH